MWVASTNKVGHIVVGQHSLFSTPAVSCIIRKRKAHGGFILTASHNPGGINADFGISTTSTVAVQLRSVTEPIYSHTTRIHEYKHCPDVVPDLSKLGTQTFDVEGRTFTVEVIDTVNDYVELVQQIFDFDAIRKLIKGSDGRPPFRALINAMHGGAVLPTSSPSCWAFPSRTSATASPASTLVASTRTRT
ncbi:hypothetical protein MTO96_010425 [Rhipicephalus appendiculatus]